MKDAPAPLSGLTATPTRLPEWIALARAETIEDAAFLSGAALAHLFLATGSADLPHGLWRQRLALAAAETCSGLAGRRDGQGGLRDAVAFLQPGDQPGPAGAILRQWSRAVAHPLSAESLTRALDGMAADRIAVCLDVGGAGPIDRAAQVIEAVLADNPRGETVGLILADAVLAQAIGRDHLLPLLSLGLRPRDLRLRGDDLRLACHRAVVVGAGRAVPLARDLARAAARLRAVAPKLRAKTAGQAVEMFLTQDAVAPGALTFMSDRAARRLCDRLVALGALRELTGRDTFRLYGL
jgi:hypothetical protein